jgi:hypothetical protein
LPFDEMQNKEHTLYCLAIAKLSVGLEQSELMPVEERGAPMKQEAPSSTRWSSSQCKSSKKIKKVKKLKKVRSQES